VNSESRIIDDYDCEQGILKSVSVARDLYPVSVISTPINDIAADFGAIGDDAVKDFKTWNDFAFIKTIIPNDSLVKLKSVITPEHITNNEVLSDGIDFIGYPCLFKRELADNLTGLHQSGELESLYYEIGNAYNYWDCRTVMHGSCTIDSSRDIPYGVHTASCPTGVSGGPGILQSTLNSEKRAHFTGIDFGGVPLPLSSSVKWKPVNYFVPVTSQVFVVEYARHVLPLLSGQELKEAKQYLQPFKSLLQKHKCDIALQILNERQSKL
jgi:hypothetical protein